MKGLGQSWHALCFCCKACGKSLRGGNYKDHDGQPYCEADHGKLFGPKGIGFGTTLGDTGIAAETEAPASVEASSTAASEGYSGALKDRTAAFQGVPIPTDTDAFRELQSEAKRIGKPGLAFQSTSPKCPACNKSVYAAEEVKGLGQSWHALCFCCKACGKSLRGGNYKDHDGQPYCEADHGKLFGPKGIGFGTTLGDTGIAAETEAPASVDASSTAASEGYSGALKDRMAAFQGVPIPTDTDAFRELQSEAKRIGKPGLAFQSTSPKCPACNKSVYAAEEVKGLGQCWHALCFCCKACGKSLRGGNYKDHDGQPYCEADHGKLFGPKGIGFGTTLGDTGVSSG